MLPPNLLLQNRYQVIRKIAQGGMGAVYEALDQRLGHRVALKQIVRGDPVVFEQEARLLARLRHPALPKVSDHFIDDVGQFLVMDFIPGENLATLWLRRKNSLTQETVLAWGDQLLAVLDYLHQQTPPVLHRDIKPANLKLTAEGQLVLLDFGLAKGKSGETDPAQKSVVGYTLAYAAPEQIRGEGTDARSDLYSAGATLYHLLMGNTPPDAIRRAAAVTDQHPDPLVSWHPPTLALPNTLLALLYKAMALNPAERFANAGAFRTALQTATQQETIVVTLDAAPPVNQTSTLIPHNLPTQLTTLVGRTEEITTLQSWLASDVIRLITLTGAGGSGKTRLALAVAQSIVDSVANPIANKHVQLFADGIFFINLATILDADLLISTIAQVLGVKETAGSPLYATLQAYLRDKRLLLLLDNFEQIIMAAPLVSDLLITCPLVKIVVTSRETLRLRGEHEFLVPLLAVPDPAQPIGLNTVTHYPAVELFVQRAQAVKPDFVLDTDNARMVAKLCTRLDGLPLAIELAAVRIKVLSPQAMLTKLADRFKFLRGGARDLPDRQRTLQATLDWSYDLLTEDEKTLFRRLAVFTGGCTLEATEAVCNPPINENVRPLQNDMLDVLASLIDKSLLYQGTGLNSNSRFMMLTTIHEYAGAQLDESEKEPLCEQHAVYYLTMVEQADPELRGPNQLMWLKQLESENDNLRAILTWSMKRGKYDIGLRLGGGLWQFWIHRGHIAEGLEQLERLLIAIGTSEHTEVKAKALTTAGILAHFQGNFVAAYSFYEGSLIIRRALGNKRGIASSLNNLGIVAMDQGNYVTARRLYEECLVFERELGNEQDIAGSLMNLGNISFYQGEYFTAYVAYEESLSILRKWDDKFGIANALGNLASVSYYQGEFAKAHEFGNESLAISQDLGYKWGISSALQTLGDIACTQSDYVKANHYLVESLVVMKELADKRIIAYLFESLLELAVLQGQPKRALCLAGASTNLRETINAPLPPNAHARHEKYMKMIHQTLDQEAVDKAWADGQAMTLDQAITYALQGSNVSPAGEPDLRLAGSSV